MANVYFGDVTGNMADTNWNTSIRFTVSGVTVTPTAGATYTNNGVTFTVTSASIAAGVGTINAGGSGTSTGSGTLTKVSGTGDATIAFSDQEDVNWFSTPGSVICGCCCTQCNVPGTPLGRVPTLADTVVVYNTVSIGPYITPWTSNVIVGFIDSAGIGGVYGYLNAGTFNGTVTVDGGVLGGTVVCNGAVVGLTVNSYVNIISGTFNNTVTGGIIHIDGGTFASAVTLQASGSEFLLSPIGTGNITFNGTIVNNAGSSTLMVGTFQMNASSGTTTFNCTIPDNFSVYQIRQATYTQPFVLGLFAPTPGAGNACFITLYSGFSTSLAVTLNCKKLNSSSVPIGSITITNSTFTGLLTINRQSQTLTITGGSYTPPAVTTPAVRSGNSMTFSSAALPIDPGFVNGGGTFNPTVLLAGTSSDLVGSGLP